VNIGHNARPLAVGHPARGFAAILFTVQYRDTAILNDMEQQVENLVSPLPFGTRVTYTIDFGDDNRITPVKVTLECDCVPDPG
jgi:hypothetical protein